MRRFWCVIGIFLVSFFPRISGATQVIAVDLAHIVDTSGISFLGTCVDRKVEVRRGDRHFPGGYAVTTYTFNVDRWLKGESGTQGEPFRFSQWGAKREEAARLGVPYLIGQTEYIVGKTYILFLTPSSSDLTSPIGLGQGVFDVIVTPEGEKIVQNKFHESVFFSLPTSVRMEKVLKAHGVTPGKDSAAIPLHQFLKTIEELGSP